MDIILLWRQVMSSSDHLQNAEADSKMILQGVSEEANQTSFNLQAPFPG